MYEVCPTDTRVLNKKGPKKKAHNFDDIVKRLNKLDLDVDEIPCFVVKNLGNLPPITFNSIDVSVLLMKIRRLNDEVLLLRAGMTSQQTTTETLKKVCEETMSRVDILEGKSFDVNKTDCQDGNNTDCHDGNTRQAKPQHKNRVIRDCVSMTVELPPVTATDVGKAAPIPVEKDTTTDIGE